MIDRRRERAELGDAGEALHEVRDERLDVVGALAQRRDQDLRDREPIVEVGAEPPGVDLGAQIAMRRGEHADVDVDRAAAADARERAALEHAEQRGLDVERQLADLVEQHGAAVRALERAGAALIRAGERAALVAEQQRRDQRRRHRAAIDDHELVLAARARVVDRARDDLLADAGLALDQHRRVDARELVHEPRDLADRFAVADELGAARDLARRWRDRLAGILDGERGVADAQLRARRDDRALDAHAADPRAVAAAEIEHLRRRRRCAASSR